MAKTTKYKYYYLSFIILFIIVSLSFIYKSYSNIQNIIENRYKDQATTINENIYTLIEQKRDSNTNMIILLASSLDIIKRLEENQFEDHKLQHLLKALKQKGKFKNVWLQIINKDGVSVYRSWSDKKGDKLINVRNDLKKLYQNPQTSTSISVGNFDMSFKAISPVYNDKNEFLGFIEIISKFNSIAKQIESDENDIVILADKQYKKKLIHAWSKKFIDNYYVANVDAKEQSIQTIQKIGVENIIRDDFKIYTNYDKMIVSTPILNRDKRTIGYAITLVPLRNIPLDDIYHLKREVFLDIIIILLLLLFVAYLMESKRKESTLNKQIKNNLEELRFNNVLLEYQQKSTEREKIFTDNILNAQTNFTLVTDGKYLLKANNAMLEFFGYATLTDFHKKHECICDFFIEEENFLAKQRDGKTWFEIIFSDRNKTHYAKMEDLNHTIRTFEFHITQNETITYNNEKLHVIVMNDVTEHFNLLRKLEKKQERLNLLIDGTDIGLFDWDIVKNKIYFSDKWKQMLGYEPYELENSFETWERLLHPEDINNAKEYLQNYLEDKIKFYNVEFRMQHKNTHWVWINAKGKVSRDKDGNPLRMVGFHQDISFAKKQELDYQRQSKMASLGEMLENIAHQWRQPLTGILNITAILELKAKKDKLESTSVLNQTQNIQKHVMYLSDTIDTFRSFLLNNNQSYENVSLQDTLQTTLELINTRFEKAKIELIEDINPQTPLKYHLIKNEFIQVLMNIFNNAIDILEEHQIQNPWIKVSLREDDTKIYFHIEDNGGGVPKDLIDKIFEPYITSKHKSQGTGIGLYMCYQIIEKKLSGKLYVQNTQNGARFTIELKK